MFAVAALVTLFGARHLEAFALATVLTVSGLSVLLRFRFYVFSLS